MKRRLPGKNVKRDFWAQTEFNFFLRHDVVLVTGSTAHVSNLPKALALWRRDGSKSARKKSTFYCADI